MSGPPDLRAGLQGQASVVVTDAMTATALGSGRIAVFASPMLVALMEAAAVDCIEGRLAAGQVSLGTHLDVRHTAPSPVGVRVTATAEITAVDGRAVTFKVEARDEYEPIGSGTNTRVVLDAARFETKVAGKLPSRP